MLLPHTAHSWRTAGETYACDGLDTKLSTDIGSTGSESVQDAAPDAEPMYTLSRLTEADVELLQMALYALNDYRTRGELYDKINAMHDRLWEAQQGLFTCTVCGTVSDPICDRCA